MRFFAHDGSKVHGPAPASELTSLPGFDGTTLVCPAGSENSADWKPALAYPVFREALLAPAPPPLPPPPTPTSPCPRCATASPESARYCGDCGARMDGRAEPAPAPSSALASDPAVSRRALLAAFLGATLAGGGLGFFLLRPYATKAPASPENAPAPPPAAPAPAPPPEPVISPVAAAPAEPAPEAPVAKPRRAARRGGLKPKPAAAAADGSGGGESLIGQHENPVEGSAAEPAGASAAAETSAPGGGFMLPGVPRPVSAKPPAQARSAAAAPPPPKPQETAAVEDGISRQVREQFQFCVQLLAQGAYDDHFDTCLCAETRQNAPYRGRRGLYAATLRKSAAAGKLESVARVESISLDGAAAKVTARWKSRPNDRERELAERWRLEDGLWCRAP